MIFRKYKLYIYINGRKLDFTNFWSFLQSHPLWVTLYIYRPRLRKILIKVDTAIRELELRTSTPVHLKGGGGVGDKR